MATRMTTELRVCAMCTNARLAGPVCVVCAVREQCLFSRSAAETAARRLAGGRAANIFVVACLTLELSFFIIYWQCRSWPLPAAQQRPGEPAEEAKFRIFAFDSCDFNRLGSCDRRLGRAVRLASTLQRNIIVHRCDGCLRILSSE